MKKRGTFILKEDRLMIVIVVFLLLVVLSLLFGRHRVAYEYVDMSNNTKYGTNCYERYGKKFCISADNKKVEVKSYKKL